MIEIVLFELDQTLPIALVEEKIIETSIVYWMYTNGACLQNEITIMKFLIVFLIIIPCCTSVITLKIH